MSGNKSAKKQNNKSIIDGILTVLEYIVGTVTALLVTILLVFSLYVLWDMFYSDKTAFISWDLLRYRPNVEEGEEPTFDELRAINEDVAGWLTIYDTNIDYPILQGKDDMEYLNKDVYGEFKLSGSIFLTSENEKDFSDPYNLIYGHHMDNGAMFGGIDEFSSLDYLDKHKEGALITPNMIYRLDIFACVSTNAYEKDIYDVNSKKDGDISSVLEYMKKHSRARLDMDLTTVDHVVALSTCSSSTTDGRIVLFAKMSPANEAYLKSHETTTVKDHFTAEGHGEKKHWAVLNLICVLASIYISLAIATNRRKLYKRIKKINGSRGLSKNWRTLVSIIFAVCGIMTFIITEDLRLPLTIIDKWTPLMIGLFALSLFTSFGKEGVSVEKNE